jgi:NADH-quinone oxidoreductase subunit N
LISKYSAQLSWQFLILQLVSILIFILGAALIFGMTGASSLSEIKVSLVLGFFQGGPPGVVLVLALVLILVSLSIQLSVFPFHTGWVKLYQEIPTPLTAFFNISVKLAFVAFLVRFFIRSFLIYQPQWIKILSFLAGISLLYGALRIFKEPEFKKTLNSLAIFQVGLILMGIVTGTEQSLQASIFFTWAYFFSNWGIYAWLVLAEKNKGEELGLSGIFRKSKIWTVTLTVLFFSLAGLPFTAGFWGRAYLLESGWSFRRFTLTAVAVITSVLVIIYFWSWIKKIFTTSASANPHPEVPLNLKLILFICFLGSLFLGVYPQVFASWALQAVKVFPF